MREYRNFFIHIIILTVLIALNVFLSGCSNTQTTSIQHVIDRDNSAVHILMYASADNRDNHNISEDIMELMRADLPVGYHFWILYDAGQRSEGLSSGVYSGIAGFWERADMSSLILSPQSEMNSQSVDPLNMGTTKLLRNFVRMALGDSMSSEQTSVLILLGESGSVFEGPLYDQGSNDFLSAGEIASVTHAINIDLIVVDAGFTAGFEFLYEFTSTDSEQPIFLLSPSAFPRSGRDYEELFIALPETTGTNSSDIAMQIAIRMKNEFLNNHAEDSLATQIIVDPTGALNFSDQFNALIAQASTALSTPESRNELRTSIFRSSPVYYETPGLAYYGISSIIDSMESLEGVESSRIEDIRKSLSELYPLEDDELQNGELSLLYVPILADGRPDPVFPNSYTANNSLLKFAGDSAWLPNLEEKTGFLYRLWFESEESE